MHVQCTELWRAGKIMPGAAEFSWHTLQLAFYKARWGRQCCQEDGCWHDAEQGNREAGEQGAILKQGEGYKSEPGMLQRLGPPRPAAIARKAVRACRIRT